MDWERTWTIFCWFGGVALAAPAVPVIPGLVNLKGRKQGEQRGVRKVANFLTRPPTVTIEVYLKS
jgi:hypothetical protein